MAPGMGLGLYVIKRLITQYNGKIRLVDPPPEYTTCFEVVLKE
jgi:signal transduction histidine kinase